jgi:hypothetical protein
LITVKTTFRFDKQKLTRFATKVNNLSTTVERVNNKLLSDLAKEIKSKLKDDPRPSLSKPRWIGHEYTGSLISSVNHESKLKDITGGREIVSSIGYYVPHGTNIEPPAELQGNILVPKGWSSNWSDTLNGRTDGPESVFPDNLQLEELYKWALHLLRNRDLDRGEKSADPRNVRRRARRLASKYFETLKEGTWGYPIIIPLFEKHSEDNKWFDKIFDAVQSRLGMDVPF